MSAPPASAFTDLHEGNLCLVDGLLSRKECDALIAAADTQGWNKSSSSGGGHGRTGREDARTNEFCVIVDPEVSGRLWSRVRQFLPADLTHIPFNTYLNTETKGAEWQPVGVVDRLRFYKYEVGEEFPEHVDYKTGRNVVRMVDGAPQKFRQQSFITLLVYLNDDFEGGHTIYWVNHAGMHCRFLRDVEDKTPSHTIVPQTGRAVLQEQNLLHAGTAPTKGTKYLLRTDIIHEKACPPHPKLRDATPLVVGETEWERIFETSCKNYAD